MLRIKTNVAALLQLRITYLKALADILAPDGSQ